MSTTTTATPEYELIYWPGFPGRGEHVRLALEEAGAAYADTARDAPDPAACAARVLALVDPSSSSPSSPSSPSDHHHPPPLAPPLLRHGPRVLLSQTPNILLYLGPRLGLAPPEDGDGDDDAAGRYVVNALALTALDGLSDEVHDVHHPVAASLYYEDQKQEALRKSRHYVAERLPKFLGYFQRVLEGDASGDGPWLYAGRLTYADLVLFQCVDGVKHAFPNAMRRLEASGSYDRVFALHAALRERPNIKAYLASERRQPYGLGIYRHYPELDPDE